MSRRRRNRRKDARRQQQGRTLITHINPRSPISEQYRTVRTNIEFSSIDQPIQSIVVTSAGPSEGKSMSAANLAVVYAQQEKKVLLIDGDLRKPTVHYTFKLDNISGLSNYLVQGVGLEEITRSSDIDNLSVIPSGPIPPNPSELLGSNRMKQFMKEAKEAYDIVIVDSPPVTVVTDAQVLSNLVDGTVLVVRSKQTEIELAIRAKEALESVNARILGTILNDLDKSASSNYYYYYGT